MYKYLISLLSLVCVIICVNSPVKADNVMRVIDNSISTSDKHTSTIFTLPSDSNQSLQMKITAYNDDPIYRRSVHFDIDGIGGDIAYALTDTITDGYIPPKQTKSWTFDLSKTYRMVVRKYSSYNLVESRDEEADVNYLDILRKSGEHKINYWVNASDKFAPESKVSVEIIASSAKPVKTYLSARTNATFITDENNYIRMKLAFDKLRSVTKDAPFNTYTYIIGKEKPKQYVNAGELSSLGDDGYILKSTIRNGKRFIVVAGNYTTGIAYGIIRLARIIESTPERLQNLSINTKPAYPLRVMYEERPWCIKEDQNRYKYQLQRYFEEGINVADIWSLPLAPNPKYLKDFTYIPPYGDQFFHHGCLASHAYLSELLIMSRTRSLSARAFSTADLASSDLSDSTSVHELFRSTFASTIARVSSASSVNPL